MNTLYKFIEKKKKFDEIHKVCYTSNCSVQGARCPLETPTPSGRRTMLVKIRWNAKVLRMCLKHAKITRHEKNVIGRAMTTGEGLVRALRMLSQILAFVAMSMEAKEEVTHVVVERQREASGADLLEEEVGVGIAA